MAHGISLALRAITLPAPRWVHEHTTPSRELRRTPKYRGSMDPLPTPYVNPARDLKRHRRLRTDLPS